VKWYVGSTSAVSRTIFYKSDNYYYIKSLNLLLLLLLLEEEEEQDTLQLLPEISLKDNAFNCIQLKITNSLTARLNQSYTKLAFTTLTSNR